MLFHFVPIFVFSEVNVVVFFIIKELGFFEPVRVEVRIVLGVESCVRVEFDWLVL